MIRPLFTFYMKRGLQQHGAGQFAEAITALQLSEKRSIRPQELSLLT
jgi:hypothetical protein